MTEGILDTTFFLDLRAGDAGASELWRKIRDGELSAGFSSVTAFELWVGDDFEPADEVFYGGLFAYLEQVRLSVFATAQAGIWLRNLSRRMRERRLRDALIAASAFERQELVYTRNLRDFRRYYPNVEPY